MISISIATKHVQSFIEYDQCIGVEIGVCFGISTGCFQDLSIHQDAVVNPDKPLPNDNATFKENTVLPLVESLQHYNDSPVKATVNNLLNKSFHKNIHFVQIYTIIQYMLITDIFWSHIDMLLVEMRL